MVSARGRPSGRRISRPGARPRAGRGGERGREGAGQRGASSPPNRLFSSKLEARRGRARGLPAARASGGGAPPRAAVPRGGRCPARRPRRAPDRRAVAARPGLGARGGGKGVPDACAWAPLPLPRRRGTGIPTRTAGRRPPAPQPRPRRFFAPRPRRRGTARGGQRFFKTAKGKSR